VRTTACSKILGNFVPPYESTVTSQLWRDGAVMLGKLNNDEFAMGSSNETRLRPGAQSVARAMAAKARQPLVPGGSSGGSAAAVAAISVSARPPPIPAVRSASPRHSPALSASSRPMAAARAGASSRSPPRSIRPGRSRARCATPRSCCARWPGRSEGYDLRRSPVPDYEAAIGKSVKGMKIGIPKEYRLDGMSEEIDKLWEAGRRLAEGRRRRTRRHLAAAHQIRAAGLLHRRAGGSLVQPRALRRRALRPARAGKDIVEMYEKTRAKGFGKEVRRRIMIGTYVLSAGYYDAYYLRAQKVRTLIKRISKAYSPRASTPS
jgi:aspartyl-tRNA(Asn)/glutamyl-tRNA(Gln) amidotransferase subunit A